MHEPLLTRCDFCGRQYELRVWNSRTCDRCRSAGAPDQGEGWDDFEERGREFRKAEKRRERRKRPTYDLRPIAREKRGRWSRHRKAS